MILDMGAKTIQCEKYSLFKTMVLGQLDSYTQKKWIWTPILYDNRKSKLKWIKNLNVRPKAIKLSEENTGVNHCDFGISSGFLNMSWKAHSKKENIHKLDFTHIKITCVSKDTTKKVINESQPTERETILENHVSDKGLEFRIYKELLQLHNINNSYNNNRQNT